MNNIGVKLANKAQSISEAVVAEGAEILFSAVVNFLLNSKLDGKVITGSMDRVRQRAEKGGRANAAKQFRSILRVYEEMGTIIATWYSNPEFLDIAGNPIPLSIGRGVRTVQSLVRASGTNVPCSIVIKLMRISPTIKEGERGMVAVRRFFSLPGFELLRAGLVIERFLETLYRNSVISGKRSNLIFERSCYADGIQSAKLALLLRDIKHRGSAFMDSVDGQIESNRSSSFRRLDLGELGVFMFAWTRLPKARRIPKSTAQSGRFKSRADRRLFSRIDC